MKKLLEQIAILDYGITGDVLTDDDIIEVQEELSACGFLSLPDDVVCFLKYYNGFLYEDRCVWGVDNKNRFIYDILAENMMVENPTPENLLLLGSTMQTYIGWHKSSAIYSIIDKSTFIQIHKFKHFAEAVRYIRKIDE